MTTAEFEAMLERISKGEERIPVDERGMPRIAKTLPIPELRQLMVAMTKGYNEQHRRIDILKWIAKARFNYIKKGGK